MSLTLGFIGTGSMGGPMVRNLLKAGHRVVICDTDSKTVAQLQKDGALPAATPAQVAAQATIIFFCLPSLAAISEIISGKNGIIGAGAVRICVNFSTAGPHFVEDIAARLAKANIILLDCPITGGTLSAADGTLSITVSGQRSTYDEVKPLLDCVARDFFHVGDKPGQAQLMKLINNMLSFSAFIASCEAMVLGTKAGMDPKVMLDIINAGTGRNSATIAKFPNNILPRTFDYGAKLAISHKDIALCLEQAAEYGVPMWMGNTTKQMIDFGVSQLGDQVDITHLIRLYEQWAGTEVTGRKNG